MRILCFANFDYLRVAENWIAQIENIGLAHRITMVALDLATANALSGKDVSVLYRPAPGSERRRLWLHRTEVIFEFLKTGVPVIHSDADAIWLTDPCADLLRPDADMVFSQGTSWPGESHAKRGFVACCGLFALRPSLELFNFTDALLVRLAEVADDQLAFNQLIDERFTDWVIIDPYRLAFHGTSFTCSPEPMRSTNETLSVAILPHHLYPRVVSTLKDVRVAHPPSGRSGSETEAALRKHGLWRLD